MATQTQMYTRRLEDVFPDLKIEAMEALDQQKKIEALIQEESDPKNRLTLMILSNISQAITANTSLTRAVHQEVKALKIELDTHTEESAALINKAEGASKIIRFVSPVVWTILSAFMIFMYHNYTDFQSSVTAQLSTIQLDIRGIEDKIGLTPESK